MTETEKEKLKQDKNDRKCGRCGRSKRRPPICICRGRGFSEENDDSAEEGEEKSSLHPELIPKHTNYSFLLAYFSFLSANNPHPAIHYSYEIAQAGKENKWFQLNPSIRILSLDEILKLLVIGINKEEILLFHANAGITKEEKEALKQVLNNIKNAFDEFKKYLKEEKGLSVEGYETTLNIAGNKLSVKIPNEAHRNEFIKQLIDKALLHPEQQNSAQETTQEFEAPSLTTF